ncbi:MAG: cytochrome C oxidase subunit IV family protein [Acidobacteriia bacterium]|nr:cytochrome C oxidase subunit IV family protein [Terriglobia bacterium]
MAEHVVSRKIYIVVWGALMVLMILTAGLSRINLGEWSTVVALAIAAIKALLVVLFFMHVRYESQKMAWVFVVAGFFWLAILLTLTMTDYVSRGSLGVVGH